VMENFDPTNHAEMNAIRLATQSLKQLSLPGCVLYSTCEPCPMCMSACLWTELDRVVYGASTMEDANLYWPQASDMTPQELVSRALIEADCGPGSYADRAACQELFRRCDEIRRQQGLELPPHR